MIDWASDGIKTTWPSTDFEGRRALVLFCTRYCGGGARAVTALANTTSTKPRPHTALTTETVAKMAKRGADNQLTKDDHNESDGDDVRDCAGAMFQQD